MPLIRKRPLGRTVRRFRISPPDLTLTTEKSRATIEGYHFQFLRHRKAVVRLNTFIPDNETLSNPRFVDVEERFDLPRRSAKVHDCRVMIGVDMYLVTGYWYRYSAINRSVKTATGLTWRGELIVVKAGRSIPYLKRVGRSHQADVAAMKYVFPSPSCVVHVDSIPPQIYSQV